VTPFGLMRETSLSAQVECIRRICCRIGHQGRPGTGLDRLPQPPARRWRLGACAARHRLIDLVNTIDAKLVAAAFGMNREGVLPYLADHIDQQCLPDPNP
jgi:hypothetical protein